LLDRSLFTFWSFVAAKILLGFFVICVFATVWTILFNLKKIRRINGITASHIASFITNLTYHACVF